MTATVPTAAASSYDEVPYESQPFAHTHPDQLATMAAVFGLKPAPAEQCRVLELGCASGGNLLPMAESLPGSTFLGVDLSAIQIDAGRARLEQLGLSNVSLQCRDIAQVGAADGLFDYVICHGVYSWVPEPVRHKILTICRDNLDPDGIAYISYNTLPGWHLRGAVREMMQFHAARFDSPDDRVEQARALLGFLHDAMPQVGGAYPRVLADELELIRGRADSYVFHEHLEEFNEPVYFHEFVAAAQSCGLRFLSEASLGEMVPNQFSAEVVQTLGRIAPDIVQMEQYMDFLRNRMFRRTLLCHAGRIPQRHLVPDRIMEFFAATPMQPDDQPDDDGGLCFRHPQGSVVTTGDRLQREALMALCEIWPARLPVAELARLAARRLGGDYTDGAALAEVARLLLDCFAADLVELRLTPQRYVTAVGDRPLASLLARLQARAGAAVTNRRHEPVVMSDLSRRTLALLDGSRTLDDLVGEVAGLVLEGSLELEHGGVAVTEPDQIARLAAQSLPLVLEDLANRALLSG